MRQEDALNRAISPPGFHIRKDIHIGPYRPSFRTGRANPVRRRLFCQILNGMLYPFGKLAESLAHTHAAARSIFTLYTHHSLFSIRTMCFSEIKKLNGKPFFNISQLDSSRRSSQQDSQQGAASSSALCCFILWKEF